MEDWTPIWAKINSIMMLKRNKIWKYIGQSSQILKTLKDLTIKKNQRYCNTEKLQKIFLNTNQRNRKHTDLLIEAKTTIYPLMLAKDQNGFSQRKMIKIIKYEKPRQAWENLKGVHSKMWNLPGSELFSIKHRRKAEKN